jgi:putative spermidine/putrescine transport system substrate-binding protein
VTYVAADSTPGYAKLVAEKANPQTDVFWSTAQTHAQGVQAGIFEKLDASIVTNLANMYSWARYSDDYGAMFSVGAVAPEYNVQIYSERSIPKPSSWNDLLNPAAKGHIVLMDLTTLQGLTTFLMINKLGGGSENNVDPGFAAIKARLADLLAIVSSPAQVDELLQQKSAWITSNQVARTYVLKDSGIPVEIATVKEGLPLVELPLDAVKGAPHPRAAQAFINWCIGAESQSIVGNKMSLGPGSKLAALDAKASTRSAYVTDPQASLVKFDFKTINANFASWTERWNKEFAK